LLQTNKSQEELILPFTRHKRERARDRRKKERKSEKGGEGEAYGSIGKRTLPI
jgi:hypothetical protein